MVPEWMHNGPSMWAEIDAHWCNIESHPAAFMCQQQSKLHKIPKSCVNWPVPAHHTCVSEHIQHTCTQYLMHAPHTSTTDYVVLSSPHFIRLRLWCGIPWSLMNTVLGNETEWICALAPRKSFPIDPPFSCSLSASFCCLQSLTPSPPPLSYIYLSFHQNPL